MHRIFDRMNVHEMKLCVPHIYVHTHTQPPRIFFLRLNYSVLFTYLYFQNDVGLFKILSITHARTNFLALHPLSLSLSCSPPLLYVRLNVSCARVQPIHTISLFLCLLLVSCKRFHIRLHPSNVAALFPSLSALFWITNGKNR